MKKSIQQKFETYDSTTRAVINVIETLGVKVTRSTISNTLQMQPTYPSLLSVSDSLSKWNVSNASYEINKDLLPQIPIPFIAQLGNHLIVVHKVSGNEITYFRGLDYKKESLDVALENWKGIILIAEKNERSGEVHYETNYRKELFRKMAMPMVLVAGVFIVLLQGLLGILFKVDYVSHIISYTGLLLVKWGGVATTIILLWYEIDKKNGFVQKICSGIANTNCSAVLNSSHAKLFKLLSWSEIGFFYYSFGFLSLLFFPKITWLIVLLNLTSVPYILFSIFYQWKIAKQWCILCLTVQFLIFIEFVINVLSENIKTINERAIAGLLYDLPVILSILFLPVGIWYLVKPLFKIKVNMRKKNRELARFKFDDEMFAAYLKKQKFVNDLDPQLGIIIGNPNGKHCITKVCNPYCGPCSKAHPEIEKLLKGSTDLKVQILFTASTKLGDKQVPPVRHLLAIAQNANDSSVIMNALDSWYNTENKNYNEFASQYQVDSSLLTSQDKKIDKMSEWCSKNDIEFTPTYYYNGHALTAQYSLSELGYFINE